MINIDPFEVHTHLPPALKCLDPVMVELLRKAFSIAAHSIDDVIIRPIAISSHVLYRFGKRWKSEGASGL